jgi:trans-aconitate methyltransferase
MLDKK